MKATHIQGTVSQSKLEGNEGSRHHQMEGKGQKSLALSEQYLTNDEETHV